MSGSVAMVVQCFVKLDTLENLLRSLLRCEGGEDIDLLLWCDGVAGSRREVEFAPARDEVFKFANNFAQNHRNKFRSVIVRENSRNSGTCKTCQISIDYAFKDHEFVIFAEDDIIFSRDALLWFKAAQDLKLLENENIWAIAGESIFFDSRDKTVNKSFVDRMLVMASERNLVNKFITHQFIPSTCFATSRTRWAEFGITRGQPLGDADVCRRCQQEDRYCLFPVVPRAKDVGMLHDYGYSVTVLTKEGVLAIKNTYILADDLLPPGHIGTLTLEPFEGSSGVLFSDTTLLGDTERSKNDPPASESCQSDGGDRNALAETAGSTSGLLPAATPDIAVAASRAGEWRRAAALWDELRTERPQNEHYWLKAGEAYCEAGILDEAEQILGAAVARFPANRWIAHRYTIVARHANNWTEVLNRAEKLRQAAPDFWPAWVQSADALAELGRSDEAEKMRRQTAECFPNEYWPNYAVAQLEAEHSDPRAALRIWLTLAERFPGQPATAAALKAASDAAEDERRAAASDARSTDPGTRGLTERLFQRWRRSSPGRHS